LCDKYAGRMTQEGGRKAPTNTQACGFLKSHGEPTQPTPSISFAVDTIHNTQYTSIHHHSRILVLLAVLSLSSLDFHDGVREELVVPLLALFLVAVLFG